MFRDHDEGQPTRKQLEETDYGRSKGWDLELEGRVVAHLDEPRWEDMFWVSYRVTPTTDDEALARQLLSRAFWKSARAGRATFRSRALGVIAPHAFPSIEPFVEPGRLNMRALYVTLETSNAGPEDAPVAGENAPQSEPRGWLARLRDRLRGRSGGA